MGYGLDAELIEDDLDRLLVRLNRCHAASSTRTDYVALMVEGGVPPVQLAQSLSRWQWRDGPARGAGQEFDQTAD
jgi:hypothetical protein